MKNNHFSTGDLLEYTKYKIPHIFKKYAASFSKICNLHDNGRKQRRGNLPESFNQEFKPTTENVREKLQQKECKQSKGAKTQKLVLVLEANFNVKNVSKLFEKICKTQYAKSSRCNTFF